MQPQPDENITELQEVQEEVRGRTLPLWGRYLLISAALVSLVFSIYIIFNLGTWTGIVPFESQYFYALQALLLPLVFLIFPAAKRFSGRIGPIDILFAVLAFCLFSWFAWDSRMIMDHGWEYAAPFSGKLAALAGWIIALEATRRAGGIMLFSVCLLFSVYPVFGYLAPGFLETARNPWDFAATYHVYGTESLIGLPTNVFAQLIIGYLLFGVALQATGGGKFFINFAFAVLGHFRGGPAKVSVIASGMMGSLSGSVVSNVLTTGVLTIPAMKKVGFRSNYAAGVEACASTGGALMPPIMGAAAFLMAFMLSIPYSAVVAAAIIPSVLYYLALFVQIDAYAARHDLSGMEVNNLPRVGDVLRHGWYFVFVLVLLIVMLLYFQQEARAPFYATALLLLLNQMDRRNRMTFEGIGDFFVSTARLFAELAAVVAGVGLIIGALSLTGKIGTLAYELVRFAGDSPVALLAVGAVTCFILGTGMTSSAAYIFLAVTLAPALVKTGLEPIAVHMFIIYWAMISFITPPVALGSFCAASVAGGSPWKTSLEAMRLGSVIYIVPFFFVLNPALIGQGPWSGILLSLFCAVIGVVFIAQGMQGYFYGVGRMETNRSTHWVARLLLIAGGFLLTMPGGGMIAVSHLSLAVISSLCIFLAWLAMRVPGLKSSQSAA